ncbi:hypothetical protein RHGRI_031288 [Rhododendron griersonianum]|uniref:Uncharacterized protein n=1 Tax=Rhododendron griersonianum TaxID=479676 RepID=A0AAV6ID45_9ERIC|nr:hypothetical protein RHGRI_031288 [Rhododendron griersonianum]
MGGRPKSCCLKLKWSSSEAKLLSDDVLLSSHSIRWGVLVFLAAKSRFIKDAEEAAEFQNFIICVEMLIAAVGHLYAFSYKEYVGANIGGSCGFTGSLAHALKLNDFYHDTVHQMELEMEMEMLVEITRCHYQSTMDR